MLGRAHAPNDILAIRTKTRGCPATLRSGSFHSPGLIGSLAASVFSSSSTTIESTTALSASARARAPDCACIGRATARDIAKAATTERRMPQEYELPPAHGKADSGHARADTCLD